MNTHSEYICVQPDNISRRNVIPTSGKRASEDIEKEPVSKNFGNKFRYLVGNIDLLTAVDVGIGEDGKIKCSKYST